MRATFTPASPARDITPKPEDQLAHPSAGPYQSPSTLVRSSSSCPPPINSAEVAVGAPLSAKTAIDPAATPTRPSAGLPPLQRAVHDSSTPESSSNPPAAPFENSREDFIDLLHPSDDTTLYKSGDVSGSALLSMSDSRSTSSTSEHGRQPPRGRGMSHPGQSRRPPARPLFQTPSVSHYPPPSSSQENRPGTSAAAPLFQGHPLPQYSYGQRGAYVGQYTHMSGQPSMGMVHPSPPQFAYPPPHPGLHAPDQSMLSPPQNQLMGYSQSTLLPMMQTHSPVYQYPGHSPESSSSSSHSFPTSPGMFSPHSRSQAHPSPPPQSPLGPPNSGPLLSLPATIPPPHSASYTGQTPYSPMRYSTPPFAYPPHSFAHSPSLYASQYPSPYPQSYPQAGHEQDTQGTWWYLPPHPGSGQYESFQSPYAMSYSPANTREVEQSQYGQLGPPPMFSPSHPSRPSPDPSTSSTTHVPYSPIAPSPHSSSYSQVAPEKSPPLQRGRPPDPAPSPISPSSASSRPSGDRPPPVRRVYHPNPPANRSEWVMWAGNVPSDATHDELWRFFNSPPSPGSSAGALSAGAQSTQSAPAGPVGSSTTGSSTSTESLYGGVLSIFLISRSNCAFVNFQSEIHLHAAIKNFNGLPLRPTDPRCPRLVCRVRGREDDLKAGVGGQRGAGIHVRWVRENRERERQARRQSTSSSDHITSESSSPTDPVHRVAGMSISSDEEAGHGRRQRRSEPHSSSSGSYASTNSSILTAYFPKRYFILKSLTQFDLDLSVEKGLWATQRHNEGILDQAFRTSKEVYLIFSVNKSGEFYGYAKMAGPIMRGEQRVSWASRTDSHPSQHTPRDSPSGRRDRETYFSPSEHRYGGSPYPMSPETQGKASAGPLPRGSSAPAEMLEPHRLLSTASEGPQTLQQLSFDVHTIRPAAPSIASQKQASLPEDIELDRSAPFRAMRDPRVVEAVRKAEAQESSLDTVAEEDERAHAAEEKGKAVDRQPRDDDPPTADKAPDEDGPVWGESFKVEWIRTERLSFNRTRHLRNPWNHDREVKVSRDGTELEPSVGQALLEEWDKLDQPQTQPPATSNVEVGRRLQGKASVSADVLSQESASTSVSAAGRAGKKRDGG